MDNAEITRRYVYHAPDTETRRLHDAVRAEELRHALKMESLLVGESREKSLMHTQLETAQFWAHAHIARNVGSPGDR